jgi:hypothetical protein
VSPPPAGNPPMIRTGRDGYVSGLARREMAGRAAAPAARCRNRRRGNLMNSPTAPRPPDHATNGTVKLQMGSACGRKLSFSPFGDCMVPTTGLRNSRNQRSCYRIVHARCRLRRRAGVVTGGELGSANPSMPNDGPQFLHRHRHRQKKPPAYPVRKDRRSLPLLRP